MSWGRIGFEDCDRDSPLSALSLKCYVALCLAMKSGDTSLLMPGASSAGIEPNAAWKTIFFESNAAPNTARRGIRCELDLCEDSRRRPREPPREEILALVQQRHLRLSVYRDSRWAIEAITRYYEQRCYLAAKIALPVHELNAERRTARIVIPIEEGPVFWVGAVEFSGNFGVRQSELHFCPLRPALRAATELELDHSSGYVEAHDIVFVLEERSDDLEHGRILLARQRADHRRRTSHFSSFVRSATACRDLGSGSPINFAAAAARTGETVSAVVFFRTV